MKLDKFEIHAGISPILSAAFQGRFLLSFYPCKLRPGSGKSASFEESKPWQREGELTVAIGFLILLLAAWLALCAAFLGMLP